MAAPSQLDAVVAQTLNRTRPGLEAHTTRLRTYNRAYEVYRSSDRNSPSTAPWQSKLRVKYGKQVIDTELVNLVTGKPRVKVLPRHPDDELAATAMQYALDFYIDDDHLVEKQPAFVQQALIYGVTGAKNHWLYTTGKQTVRDFALDPTGQSVIEQNPQQIDVVLRDGPCFDPWDINDMWWDPDGRDVDTCDYVVLRSWVSPDYVMKRAFNPDTNQGVFHNVDQLLKTGPGQQRDATAQETFLGGADQRRKGKIEIWEVWRDDELIVIGNRQVLLRHVPNPYWHGRKPIVISQAMPDLFEMQGISETEVVDHIQQALQTLQNMTIDNVHLTTMRGITYRESGVIDPNALELKPRFKWPVADHDDIRPFEVPPISTDVYTERQRLLQDLQLVTGVNPYVSGSDLSGVDQNTATGVTALQEVASRLLRFKASMIQYKGYQRTYEQWASMIKQFLDHDLSVKIEGPGSQYTWAQVAPHQVQGAFDVKLEGSEESLSKQQERGEAVALLNAFAPLAPLGIINFQPILEKVAAAYDFPNPQALMAAQQQQPAAAPGQQPPDLFGVMQPRIGANPYAGQGGLQMDPRLGNAMAQLPVQGMPGLTSLNPAVASAINRGR